MMLSSLCKATLSKQLEHKVKPDTDINGISNGESSDDILTFSRLKSAIVNSDDGILRKIISAGRSVEYLTAEGSLLYAAVKYDAPLWFIEELLEFEANPNYFSYQDHQTALHYAAEKGNLETLESLLDYGGNPLEQNASGKTVIEVAIESNNHDCVELLQRILRLQQDLQLRELGDEICEKHRLSTICEKTERSATFNSYNSADAASLMESNKTTQSMNCAFCHETTLQEQSVSKLVDTSPPTALYDTTRHALSSVENISVYEPTPKSVNRARRRLLDSEGFKEMPSDGGVVKGFKDGIEKVAAGILAYLSPEKKPPERERTSHHPEDCESEESTFESAKSTTSDNSRTSIELEKLDWTKNQDEMICGDISKAILCDLKPWNSTLFTEDVTIDNAERILDRGSTNGWGRTPVPNEIQHLTDEALFDKLKLMGMNPGPINDSTRPIYLHQLSHLKLGNDVRLTIGEELNFSLSKDISHSHHHADGDCCQIVHRDLESGLMLREEHYGPKRAILPTNVVQAGQSQAVPPELVKLSNEEIREKLLEFGEQPGPVNRQTRAVYLRQLHRVQQQALHKPSPSQLRSILAPELHQLCVRFEQTFEAYSNLEQTMEKSFRKPGQRWREGSVKTAFTYLLLDSSITLNLPLRAANLSLPEQMEVFAKAIFYVGKGKRSRPFAHLYEAIDVRNRQELINIGKATPGKLANAPKVNEKIKRILKIWDQGHGVISLHVFQNVIPVEAFTREGAMIEALGINRLLTNEKRGEFYGVAETWNTRQRKQLGAYLVYRALQVFLAEGERRLGPLDL